MVTLIFCFSFQSYSITSFVCVLDLHVLTVTVKGHRGSLAGWDQIEGHVSTGLGSTQGEIKGDVSEREVGNIKREMRIVMRGARYD